MIVVNEPEMLSDLISEKLHALADDYCDISDSELYQCTKFYQECRDGVVANERLLSDSSDSSGSESDASFSERRKRPKPTEKKRVRWRSNLSSKLLVLYKNASKTMHLYANFYILLLLQIKKYLQFVEKQISESELRYVFSIRKRDAHKV